MKSQKQRGQPKKMNQIEYIKELHDRERSRMQQEIDELKRELTRLKKEKTKKKAVRAATQNGKAKK